MVEGVEAAYLVNKLFHEIYYNNDEIKSPVEAVTDNYSLFEAVKSTTFCTDRRLRIEMAILKECLDKSEVKLKWVNSANQLADCLTKSGSNPRSLLSHITGKQVL